MPQISLYIDETTLRKVENAALRQHVSISKWVAEQIRARVEPVYPAYFEGLFGSINDASFTNPRKSSFSSDLKREGF